MAAYAVFEIEYGDPELVAQYRALAQVAVARYDGKYLVRAGAVEPVEGTVSPTAKFVVLEFPSMERANAWYASPDYAAAREIGKSAYTRRVVFLEGVAPA